MVFEQINYFVYQNDTCYVPMRWPFSDQISEAPPETGGFLKRWVDVWGQKGAYSEGPQISMAVLVRFLYRIYLLGSMSSKC